MHPAIPLREPRAELSDQLPAYIDRDVDPQLRSALRTMQNTGGFILLVGAAASGKTRCLYEAIRAEVPTWPILVPDDLQQLDHLSAGRVVIWLDNVGDPIAEGRISVGTIRKLLAVRRRPVIVLGAIWPKQYEKLRTANRAVLPPGERGAQPADGTDAVLALARPFEVAPHLSDAEMERARQVAEFDPRVGEVLAHPVLDGATALLAAAPELLRRLSVPGDAIGGRVLTAAVDARVHGHPDVLPARLLEELTERAYLSPSQRALLVRDWFTDAVTWATEPVRGDIAALRPHGSRPGTIEGYQVSDILVQRAGEQASITPEQVTVLIELATPDACIGIGAALYQAGRRAGAETAWRRAAAAGLATGMFNLGILFSDDDATQSRAWYLQAARAGHAPSMTSTGYLAEIGGDPTTAQHWYTRAAELGDQRAAFNLALMAERNGDLATALRWYTTSAELRDVDSMVNLGTLLADQKDVDGATRWMRRAAEAGSVMAMGNLGQWLRKHGDLTEAREWLQRGAEAGGSGAMFGLAALLDEIDGDLANAIAWYEKAVDAGSTRAVNNLGMLLWRAGDLAAARHWLERAAETSEAKAMANLGELALAEGATNEAIDWFQRSTAAGDPRAALHLADIAFRAGQIQDVRDNFTAALRAENTAMFLALGHALHRAGHPEPLHDAFQQRAATAHPTALLISQMLMMLGDHPAVTTWLKSASLDRDAQMILGLTFMLACDGHTDALRYWRDRAEVEGRSDYTAVLDLLATQTAQQMRAGRLPPPPAP
ncbi:SEL1-like repeat protein [Dactylosporangium sp. CA-139066]|uniref:SEL1-like repeat protein n=1 Tax=Dactylosporangium sp. CA-139066 TaxID=3239930 RepID=UPI003D8D0E4E